MLRKPPLAPVKRRVAPAPPIPAATRPFPPARLIRLPGYGPEDVIACADNFLLTGLDGGAIVRVDPESGAVAVVADTHGRPLGLEPLPDGRIAVCDSRRGLLAVDVASGTVEILVREVAGVPMRFCSNATVQRDGTIWFTESTTRFDFETYLGAFLEHAPSGRLMRRDTNGAVDVVLDGLYFPNGIALFPDESALLFAETANYSISRLSLTGEDAGRRTVVIDNMPGFPDNMSGFRDGRCWVPLTNPRNPLLDRLGQSSPILRKLIWRLPDRLVPNPEPITWVVAMDVNANIIEDVHQQRPDFHMATGAVEHNGALFLASPESDALLLLTLD